MAQRDDVEGRPRGRRVRTRRPLSRERILDKALTLLEAAPEQELSMRALADALGVSPMSLYRHVRNKEDLLDGITEQALGKLDVMAPERGPWTERTHVWMLSLREQLHAHPAVIPLLRTHSRYAPALLHAMNGLLRLLRGAGFGDGAAVRATREILWFVFGFVVMEIRSREEFPQSEVGAISVAGLPASDSPEASDLSHLFELMPHFVHGDVDETYRSGARHLLAGIDAERATRAALAGRAS